MIERYTRPEMRSLWSEQRKLETWLAVELAVVEALAETGVVPREDAALVRERASFTAEAVRAREEVTDHDVAAFVDVVAGSVGGGLDALLSIAQMPPGVPVACVGVDNPKNAAVLAARILSV